MADYIDLRLDIDASRTRCRLDWNPNADLHVLKRIPFMIENMSTRLGEWNLRNTRRKPGKAERDLRVGIWRNFR